MFPNPSDNLKVIAEGGSMKVIVRSGKAWINGYYYENDSDLTLLIENADGVLNRIDRVVVRLDLIEREISVQIKEGIYSSSAVAEDIERNSDIYELAIADIKISNGIISLNNSNITDLRLNKELCGVVCGTIDEVDTTDIFNTYQYYLDEKINSDEFNEWFIGLKNRLNPNEDAALQLQIQINELEKKLGDSLKTDGTLQENLNADMIDGKQADGELITNEKENLVAAINEVFTYANDGKDKISNAIIGKGVTTSANDTFTTLAAKVGKIATDTTATVNDVLSGKTVYINGAKATGNIIQRTGHQYAENVAYWNIGVGGNSQPQAFLKPPLGYYYGDSWIRQEVPDLRPENIISGKNVFGCGGTATIISMGGMRVAIGTVTSNATSVAYGNYYSGQTANRYSATITGFGFTPRFFILYGTKSDSTHNFSFIDSRQVVTVSSQSSASEYVISSPMVIAYNTLTVPVVRSNTVYTYYIFE